MANVIKKHSISYGLAQKMAIAAVAKARELGVTENVAILDDGGNLKAFSRMDGTPTPTIEIAQNKAYTALFGVSTQEFFNFIQQLIIYPDSNHGSQDQYPELFVRHTSLFLDA